MDGAAAEQPSVPAGYALVRLLGHGRCGPALLCRDGSGRETVVRVVAAANPDGAASAAAELQALAAAGDHPCAVRTLRVWTDPELGLCLEQEYCAGGPLDEQVPMSEADALVGTARVAAVLGQLHGRGVLHRDVRPANVLLNADGQWCLADAGLTAALGLAPAETVSTPRELRGWEPAAPAADVYGLGATLLSALAGRPPLGAAGGAAGPPLPTSTPPMLATLIDRMLAQDPAERPALPEIDQVVRTLVPAPDRDRLPPPVPPLPVRPAPQPRVKGLTEPPPGAAARRRGVLIAVGAAILFFAGAGAVIATDGGTDNSPAELAVAPASPLPTVAPAATPSRARKSAPKAAREVTPKLRGTAGTATGPDVRNGLKPRQFIAFVYRGRLAVLFDMERVSDKIKRFEIFSARPDGSDRALGDDQPGGIASRSYPLRQAYFFGPDVSLDRCVQIRVTLESGRLVPDNRTVCPVELTGTDLRDADSGWADYLKYLAGKNATPRPTPKPTARTAGRDT
ncbi:MAG TPA: protein kinase [Sporichthya sp.]|nr:protein kinase [Sporichthya sp.]